MTHGQSIFFDMDGVLVDSEPFWQRFWREHIFTRIEDGDPGLEEVTGRNFRESLEDLADRYTLPKEPEHYAQKFESAAETVYGKDVSITPGIPEFFELLHLQGVNVGIVSSAPKAWIDIVIDRFGLAPVDIVVSAEQLDDPGKSEPFIYERAADMLTVEPESCIVVEDSVNGIQAAAHAGSTVIRFCKGANVRATPNTDFTAESPQELHQILDGLVF